MEVPGIVIFSGLRSKLCCLECYLEHRMQPQHQHRRDRTEQLVFFYSNEQQIKFAQPLTESYFSICEKQSGLSTKCLLYWLYKTHYMLFCLFLFNHPPPGRASGWAGCLRSWQLPMLCVPNVSNSPSACC